MSAERAKIWDLAVVAFACVLPTLVTLAYFVWAAEAATGVQQTVYGVAKVLQFALPVIWVGLVCRERLHWPVWRQRGIGLGIAFGVAVCAALWLLYFGLSGSDLLSRALVPIREKVADLGLATTGRFIALGVFYSLIHSLLEEYYWRWFVFGRMRRHLPLLAAIALSSVAFAIHHVIVLWAYFSHFPPMAVLLAGCVGLGGAFWAWLYDRSGSLYSVWISHLLVDVGIFALGYHVARPLFAGA